MRVYRIEHAFDGLGPYALHGGDIPNFDVLDELAERLCRTHLRDPIRPGFREDDLGVNPWSDDVSRFGFPTRRAMRTWFSGWCLRLAEAGHVEAIYEVPRRHVMIGTSGRQLMFDVGRSRRVAVRPLPKREWRVTS